jgi:methyl-accepting chemotaxis protein
VAEEVRSLAGRTAEAARETAGTIESSGRKVEHDLDVAEVAAEALGQIAQNVL